VCCCRRLTEKNRSRVETIFLETSIYPAGRGTEGTIHDGEGGEMQLIVFEGQIRSRASPRETGVLSKGEKTSKKESKKLKHQHSKAERKRSPPPLARARVFSFSGERTELFLRKKGSYQLFLNP
jgi:hypothetical protein